MQVNVEAIQQLIDTYFRGNIAWFADEIGVNRSYISSILNHKRKADSDKIIVGIIAYCKRNNLNYEKYVIFFETTVKKN